MEGIDIKTLKVKPGDTIIITFGQLVNRTESQKLIDFFETVYPEAHIVWSIQGDITDISVIQYQEGGELGDYLL